MLTEKEQIILNKKMRKVEVAQRKQKLQWIKDWELDKDSNDPKWHKFVEKRLAWIDKFHYTERRQWNWMFTRALYDLRKGRKSPWIDLT